MWFLFPMRSVKATTLAMANSLHADQQWTPLPSFGSLLYALELPQDGGQTSWLNTIKAYNALPDDVKKQIDQLQLITYNPFVRTHPESGHKALWLNTRSEVELLNVDDSEGSELLAVLRAHILKPEFRYKHQWETGDIVFWDNQVTLHSRRPFPVDQRRLLKHIILAGGRPYQATNKMNNSLA